jgi:hypothetical protein
VTALVGVLVQPDKGFQSAHGVEVRNLHIVCARRVDASVVFHGLLGSPLAVHVINDTAYPSYCQYRLLGEVVNHRVNALRYRNDKDDQRRHEQQQHSQVSVHRTPTKLGAPKRASARFMSSLRLKTNQTFSASAPRLMSRSSRRILRDIEEAAPICAGVN